MNTSDPMPKQAILRCTRCGHVGDKDTLTFPLFNCHRREEGGVLTQQHGPFEDVTGALRKLHREEFEEELLGDEAVEAGSDAIAACHDHDEDRLFQAGLRTALSSIGGEGK